MPGFEKPDFTYSYNVDAQITALRSHRDTAPGRAIPVKAPGRLLVASWNIANLGVHERRDRDHRLIAEMISWFDLVAVQEVNDDLSGLRAAQAHLPSSYRVVFSDKAGNDERMCFVYDSDRVALLEKVGEVAVPPRWKYVIRVPGSDQKFTGFDRNPYLAAFKVDDLTMVLVNVHLYFGGDTTYQHNRRFMEALATARWADLRRDADNAFTPNIIVMGDFNMYNADWSDPIWKVLVDKGLYLVPHSTYVGGSNIRNDRAYDQVAFFPGPIKDAVEATGVFDFDGGVFAHLWDTKTRVEFMAYTQYYLSDHRILWAALATS